MRKSLIVLMALVLLAACGPGPAAGPTLPPAGSAEGQTTPTPEPTAPPPTPTEEAPPALYVQPGVPSDLRSAVALALPDYEITGEAEAANVQLTLGGGGDLAAEWVYALAAPFATVPDGLTWADFTAYWQTGSAPPGFEGEVSFVATADVVDMLIAQLGPANGININVVGEAEPEQVAAMAWANRPALAVVPFHHLDPSLKVLAVDGVSPLDKDADLSAYPLAVDVSLSGAGATIEGWQATNRDPARITNVVLTGTTAIARATAMQVELRGVGFPSQDIQPFFADADILHTSNESSYATDCPEPDWVGEPKFCSQRAYFDVLSTIGLDIVEKTGNHISDYGIASLSYTLDVYDNNGLPYYGGGRTLADALTPRIITAPDGTRVAFIGCNSAGPFPVWATDATPGAAPCDDWSAITERIRALKANDEADVVIATLQYLELPTYVPSEQQIADFAILEEAGADIISGSQAHQPQGFSVQGDAFIHYGIGNLFFDQMDFIENRRMFADKHVLYEGQHISTVLFTGLMEDWARPRPMTDEERAEFLEIIFEASGW